MAKNARKRRQRAIGQASLAAVTHDRAKQATGRGVGATDRESDHRRLEALVRALEQRVDTLEAARGRDAATVDAVRQTTAGLADAFQAARHDDARAITAVVEMIAEVVAVISRWRDAARISAIFGLGAAGAAAIAAVLVFDPPPFVGALTLTSATLPLVGAVAILLNRVSAKSGVYFALTSLILTYIGALTGLYFLILEVSG
jgi:hypothetical protein